MRTIFNIAKQTIRSSVRSKVFFVLFVIILIATITLPVSTLGDNSLAGTLQVKVNYSLGFITFLLSFAILWLTTNSISSEVEGYQIHMVLTKPVSAVKYWLGKWLGAVFLSGIILLTCSSWVYYQVISTVKMARDEALLNGARFIQECNEKLTEEQKKDRFFAQGIQGIFYYVTQHSTQKEKEIFSKMKNIESNTDETLRARLPQILKKLKEYDQVKETILTGRDLYKPEYPNFHEIAQKQFNDFKAQGKVEEGKEKEAINKIFSQLRSSFASIQYQYAKKWEFKNLPKIKKGEKIFVRYKIQLGTDASTRIKDTAGWWMLGNPKTKKLDRRVPWTGAAGTVISYPIPSDVISDNGSAVIAFSNYDPGKVTIVFPVFEGPFLLIGSTSFFQNYYRCILLIFLFIGFLAMVGCSAGCCFSTPVAIYFSFSYLFVCMAIISVTDIANDAAAINLNLTLIEQIAVAVKSVLQYFMISVGNFVKTEFLTSGKTINSSIIWYAFIYDFFLKGIPLVLIGIGALWRREMGLVVKKQ